MVDGRVDVLSKVWGYLKEEGEVFVCVKGKMETSGVVDQGLREYASSEPVPFEKRDTQLGGTWYCPSCAANLREQKTSFSCTACGRGLAQRLIYKMTQFHPHQDS